MQYSFYGGQQGKNFEIAKIFHNKVELMQDLMKRWHSSIGVGELVLISYGLPSDLTSQSYQKNRDLDLSIWKATYNVSVWQKIYTEISSESESEVLLRKLKDKYQADYDANGEWPQEYWDEYYAIGGIETQYIINGLDKIEADYEAGKITEAQYYEEFAKIVSERSYISEDFGLGYKLVASLIGVSPNLTLDFAYLNADELPNAWLTFADNNVEKPILHFRSPQAQEFLSDNVSTTVLDVDEEPAVVMENAGTNTDGSLKVNKPTLEFKLPQGQQILSENVKTTVLNADEEPKVVFDNDKTHTNADGSSKINKPSLDFQLPQSQIVGLGNVVVLDADQSPKVTWDDTNINNPKINISLPQSQILVYDPDTNFEVLPPSKVPNVTYDDTNINNPEYTFHLPRAVKFMYGDRLGTRVANGGIYTLTLTDAPEIEELRTGDYYVNRNTGFIYLVTDEDTSSRTFTYQACLATPAPEIEYSPTDAHKKNDAGDWEINAPKVIEMWVDNTEKTGQSLRFELPKPPALTVTSPPIFVGPDVAGKVEGAIVDKDTYDYKFTIPRGAKFFCGTAVDDDHLTTSVAGAEPGDFYINGKFDNTINKDAHSGKVYKLVGNAWVYQGSIKGDTGNPLNITHDFLITPTEVANDNLNDVATYLETQLGGKPSGDEIIAVTYRAPATSGGTIDTAYWYYVTNNAWGRAQLTGATASLIENSYKAAGDANKAYSVTYINNLLAALDAILTPTEKKIKTYSAEAIEDKISWGSFKDL